MTEKEMWVATLIRYERMYELIQDLDNYGIRSYGSKKLGIPPCEFCKQYGFMAVDCEEYPENRDCVNCIREGCCGKCSFGKEFKMCVKEDNSAWGELLSMVQNLTGHLLRTVVTIRRKAKEAGMSVDDYNDMKEKIDRKGYVAFWERDKKCGD